MPLNTARRVGAAASSAPIIVACFPPISVLWSLIDNRSVLNFSVSVPQFRPKYRTVARVPGIADSGSSRYM
eukprot:COSAG02_NODE_2336_length_9114_cov_4.097615_1_plen_71_part_00